MDVDEDEDATQRPKRVPDFGIEVDFDKLDEGEREVRFVAVAPSCVWLIVVKDAGGDKLAEYDASITKLNADIERMAPNLKAIDRCVFSSSGHVPIYIVAVDSRMSRPSWQTPRRTRKRPANSPRTRGMRLMTSRNSGT